MKDKSQVAVVLSGAAIVTLLYVLANAVEQSPESHDVHPGGARERYAEANLDLATIELQIALTANEKIPNLYSPRTIRRLRNNVTYAKEVLRYETEHEANGLHDLHLRELKVEQEVAESELASGLKFNEQLPGSLSDLEIEKLHVATNVAQLALEKASEPAVLQSREDHLQWQLDRMRSEMTRLHVLMDKALARN